MQVLLDTNIVLSHLRDATLQDVSAKVDFVISVITLAEVLRLPGLGVEEIVVAEKFLRLCRVLVVDEEIGRKAAELGRTRKTKLPDLFIAATALHFGLPLVTLDKDFRHFPGLIVKTSLK